MSKKLVIVESPAKAKTISKILGKDYVVKSSVGHIRDLPEKSLGVDVENEFKPSYVVSSNKKKLVEELKKAAKSADIICLAPDPDREGEAIAWHLKELLQAAAPDAEFQRVQYNEITPRAVKAAFDHPGLINMDRVNAQQARRVLDRIVGYQVSPLLWKQVKRGASAGRVQSVALRLVCERERLIQAFRPDPYWVMGARLSRGTDQFTVKLAKIDSEKPEIKDEAAAKAFLDELTGRALRVADVRTREVTRRPLAPFITSTLQQAASSVCGFSPNRTMALAQSLYEGVEYNGVPTGLITYMRTDSVAISQDARNDAKQFILDSYGDAFYPEKPNFYTSRSGAQEAHEAIRPTDVNITPDKVKDLLDAPALKLYDLIWKRFVASQMSAAKIAQRTVEIESVPPPRQKHHYLFTATASDIAFPGFLKVMMLELRKAKKPQSDVEEEEEETDEVDRLPELALGDSVNLEEWLCERKETKPPTRFSEASLIKALESDGVGRPSTYAAIIETLDARKYITRVKRQISPTEFGFQVNDLLVSKLSALFDVKFTAQMEADLDRVESGEVPWVEMLAAFYKNFQNWLQLAKEPPADPAKVSVVIKLLGEIKKFNDPVKIGRRIMDDARFVKSVTTHFHDGEGSLTERQLTSLVKMALRYKSQLPTLKFELTNAGFGELLRLDEASVPESISAPRFALLAAMELPDETRRFVMSVKAQEGSGHKLSEAQIKVLDRLIARNVHQVPGGAAELAGIGIDVAAATAAVADSEPDSESQEMIAGLDKVAQWAEPFKRGRFVYDDKDFFTSLKNQFAQRNFLSQKQRFVLKRLITKYAEQIDNFEELSEKFNILPPQNKSKDGGEKTESVE